MKAAVLTEIGQPLSVLDVPMPDVKEDEVLVKTKACGICGTDVHMMHGWGYTPRLPHIPGHEPAGVVAKVGNNVRTLKPGDRVIPNIFQSCGRCPYCLQGRDTLCDSLSGITGVLSTGAFAEYFVAAERNLFILPDEISFEAGCVIADAVVTAVHAIDKTGVSPVDTVGVIGIGGVGQNILSLARHMGAGTVAFDVASEKLRMAEKLGASATLLFQDEGAAGLLHACNVIFDCVGKKQTLETAIQHAPKGAKIIVVGYENEAVEIKPQWIAQKELLIQGSRSGTKLDTSRAIEYVRKGIVQPFISGVFQLDSINEALEMVKEGRALGRTVITF